MRGSRGKLALLLLLWGLLAATVFWLRKTWDAPHDEGLFDDTAPHVLFVGNSYTYVNDLPGTFAKLAASRGHRVVAKMYALGAYSFEKHAKDGATRKNIESREWDFVVLQDQSQRPAFDEYQVKDEVLAPARVLDQMIHARSPHAVTVFFETWGREHGDAQNCKEVPRICTYDGMQERLHDTYSELARENGARLSPVGQAWQRALGEHPDIRLFGPDGSHPTAAGTYLAACVLFDTLFGGESKGAEAIRVTAAEASVLQAIADETPGVR